MVRKSAIRAKDRPFWFVVRQQTAAMIERFGKFSRVAPPGLHLKVPFVERVVGTVNMRVQQLDVKVETKTKDDVFVHVVVSRAVLHHPREPGLSRRSIKPRRRRSSQIT